MKDFMGNFQSVRNINGNNGPVRNQFIIYTDKGQIFQSYNSIIVAYIGGKVYLDENHWDYSNTTGKYRNMFLGESKKETERKIKEKKYILTNLN
jgi:hypothetical protein